MHITLSVYIIKVDNRWKCVKSKNNTSLFLCINSSKKYYNIFCQTVNHNYLFTILLKITALKFNKFNVPIDKFI